MKSEALYERLRASDEAVAKALNLSEVGQIAKLEGRVREFLLAQWEGLAKQAINRASSMAKAGKPAKSIAAGVRRIMVRFPRKVLPQFARELDKAHQLARVAGWKKATKQTRAALTYDTPNLTELVKAAPAAGFAALPTFTLADEAAVAALVDHQGFWLGELYGSQVAEGIATTASEVMVQAGADRVRAGALMRERMTDQLGHIRTPEGFSGSAKQYFEGVAANAVTTARAVGQLVSFQEAEITIYEITNPRDSRTCPICNHVDGKRFSVGQGQKQIDATLEADTPEAVKAAHPWLSVAKLKEISPRPGNVSTADSGNLAKAGQALPPYHFRCRCAVDVA